MKLTTPPMQAGPRQMPGMTMELTATGKGAKPLITKPPKPFDPQEMMGGAAPTHGSKNKVKK